MKFLKREVYHFAGKDYEKYDVIKFDFVLESVKQIQNFTELLKRFNIRYTINGTVISTTSFMYKLYEILCDIGLKETSDVWYSYLEIKHKKYYNNVNRHRLINRFSCFNPNTKETKYVSRTPIKMGSKQQIINGKLWRQIF